MQRKKREIIATALNMSFSTITLQNLQSPLVNIGFAHTDVNQAVVDDGILFTNWFVSALTQDASQRIKVALCNNWVQPLLFPPVQIMSAMSDVSNRLKAGCILGVRKFTDLQNVNQP